MSAKPSTVRTSTIQNATRKLHCVQAAATALCCNQLPQQKQSHCHTSIILMPELLKSTGVACIVQMYAASVSQNLPHQIAHATHNQCWTRTLGYQHLTHTTRCPTAACRSQGIRRNHEIPHLCQLDSLIPRHSYYVGLALCTSRMIGCFHSIISSYWQQVVVNGSKSDMLHYMYLLLKVVLHHRSFAVKAFTSAYQRC